MADWLSLAAAPTFAIMAVLTAVPGSGADMLCSVASPLSGMVPMYLLMSAFHSAPWLRLITNWRSVTNAKSTSTPCAVDNRENDGAPMTDSVHTEYSPAPR
jgi:hypothetical protein